MEPGENTPLSQEQLTVLNIVQAVLRDAVVAMCALNPSAMPRVELGLRAAAAANEDDRPAVARMLADLATGVELLAGERAPGAPLS